MAAEIINGKPVYYWNAMQGQPGRAAPGNGAQHGYTSDRTGSSGKDAWPLPPLGLWPLGG